MSKIVVGSRICVSESLTTHKQLWGTVTAIDLPKDGFVKVAVKLKDGIQRAVAVRMPESALHDPWVPAPIKDAEALEQWLRS